MYNEWLYTMASKIAFLMQYWRFCMFNLLFIIFVWYLLRSFLIGCRNLQVIAHNGLFNIRWCFVFCDWTDIYFCSICRLFHNFNIFWSNSEKMDGWMDVLKGTYLVLLWNEQKTIVDKQIENQSLQVHVLWKGHTKVNNSWAIPPLVTQDQNLLSLAKLIEIYVNSAVKWAYALNILSTQRDSVLLNWIVKRAVLSIGE